MYCAHDHDIADQILTNNPGNAFAINIHVGGYANPSGSQPDFRTQWGAAIDGQAGVTGYPAGTVNRHVFPGWGMVNGRTAMGRHYWSAADNEIISTPSYLNMTVEDSLYIDTRELTVHVDAYYNGYRPKYSNR